MIQGLDFAYESWGADRRLFPAMAMRRPKRNVGPRKVRSCISSSIYSGKTITSNGLDGLQLS